MQSIPLAELLMGLRKELVAAQRQAAQEQLRFKIEDIEIEVQVGTNKTGSLDGGLNLWVLDVKAEGSIEAQKLQTLRLKIKPLDAAGGDIFASDQDSKDSTKAQQTKDSASQEKPEDAAGGDTLVSDRDSK